MRSSSKMINRRNRRRPHKTTYRAAKPVRANKNRNEKHRRELAQIHESASDSGPDDEDCIDSNMDRGTYARQRQISECSDDFICFEKKVTFNLCPIVYEIGSETREGIWQQVGRDRERFERKINELGAFITPVLTAAHRTRIFNERFRSPATANHDDNTK